MRVQSDYNQRNQLMLGLRRQRMMRARVAPPQVYQRFLGQGVKLPISNRLIQTVVGAVAGEERPTYHVSSPDPEISARTERWLKLVTQRQESFGQPGLYWRFWDSLAGDGMVVMKTSRRPWLDYPQRMEGEEASSYNAKVKDYFQKVPPLPFRTRVLDPMTFYPPRSEWGRDYYIEYGLRPSTKVMLALNLRPDAKGGFRAATPDEPVPQEMSGLSSSASPYIPVTEIWDGKGDKLLVDVAGQIWEYENELGVPPYVYTFATAVAFSDPTFQAASVAFPLMYLEPWINQILSTLVGYSQLQATPTPYVIPKGGTPGGGETKITDFKPGMMHEFTSEVNVGIFDMGNPAASLTVLNTLVQLAERFTISPVPTFAGSRTAATALAQATERVMSILTPLVDQAQVAWADQAKMWVTLVRDVIKAPVVVSGLTFEEKSARGRKADTALSPRDVQKIGDILTEIRFRTATDKIAWHTHNVMMQQSGLWSKRHARLESDVVDPDAEEKQKFIETLLESPAIQLLVQQRGMQDQPPLQTLIQMLGEQLGAGPGAGPPVEGAGEEPSGLPPGATAGVPRAPGGERGGAPAPKGRMR